jgi:hypothetical protein
LRDDQLMDRQSAVDEPAVLCGPLAPVGWSIGFVESPCDVIVHRLFGASSAVRWLAAVQN